MFKFLAKREMSIWLIIAAIILDAIMITPSFWGAFVHAIAALCMFAARKVAMHEARLGTNVSGARSSPVAPRSGAPS